MLHDGGLRGASARAAAVRADRRRRASSWPASVGPTDAVVIDVIHPALRATAASILSLTRNLFGLAGGPLLTGVLSDAYGLQFAMAVVPLFGLLAAAMYMVAARTYVADLQTARNASSRPSQRDLKPQAA